MPMGYTYIFRIINL